MTKHIQVVKASGDRESYSDEKLRTALERSGAGEENIERILNAVEGILYDGISTKKIYAFAFSQLKKASSKNAEKFTLKKAILELGPSGYPFEKFFAEILKFQGYKIKVGDIIEGHCVSHEVDIIAEKDDKHFMIECKFHNRPGYLCDVKIPLYVQSRFLDIEKNWKSMPGHENKLHQGWLVTNTRFSSEAIKYGNCVGLHLIGWDYPKSGSLREQIDLAGLYPITALTTLSKKDKKAILDEKIVLVRELLEHPEVLDILAFKPREITKILKDASDLCRE